MRLSFRALNLLSSAICVNPSPLRPIILRCAKFAIFGLLAFSAGPLLEAHASAQIPLPGKPECVDSPLSPCDRGTRSSSSESAEERKARLQREAEERAERNAEKEREKKAKKLAKEEARRRAEAARQEAEAVRLRAIEAQRQRVIEAERQRRLTIEAQRLQAIFDERKPAALNALKGIDAGPSGPGDTADNFGLKGADNAWDAHITDTQIAKVAKRLNSFVPPLPIPKEEVSVTWKQIYLNDNRLLNTTDYIITGWEVAGVLSGAPFAGYKLFLISGKSLIAGQAGAYLHLVKREQDYDAALRFLKNPAQSQQFAHLVEELRQNRPLPADANPDMIKAARAISDPKLGSTQEVIWDAMLSREALSAMLRKASIELITEATIVKADKFLADKLLKDLSLRKAAYDSLRLEREQARKMLALEATTPQQREQWTAVIKRVNFLSAAIFKTEQTTGAYVDKKIGDAIDQLATLILGPEAEMPEYK